MRLTQTDIDGEPSDLGREGGHSKRRILHARDITGREIAECELPVRYVNMRWEVADDALPGMTPERHAILEGIRTHGPIQAAALGRELRLGRTAVQYHIDNLVRDGHISKHLGGYVVNNVPSLTEMLPVH